MTQFKLTGKTVAVDGTPDTPELWVLRDHLGMTGTKFGCGKTPCRACTVHVDGVATFLCLLPLSAVQGKRITTIEGLHGHVAKAVQSAWDKIQVPQCGYCQSGQVMAATALLTTNPAAERRRYRSSDAIQSVPLRELSPDPLRDPRSGKDAGGVMSSCIDVDASREIVSERSRRP